MVLKGREEEDICMYEHGHGPVQPVNQLVNNRHRGCVMSLSTLDVIMPLVLSRAKFVFPEV